MEIIWRVIRWEGGGGEQGTGTWIKKHNWQVQNRQGDVKNHVGNGEAKELTCTTHRPKVRRWIAGGNGDTELRGAEGKHWDNYDSIINKIHLKNKNRKEE